MRTTAATLGALLLALSVGACSGSGVSAYCDAVRAAQPDWTSAGSSLGNRQSATRFVASVRTIEQNAPEEVRADWSTLREFFQTFTAGQSNLSSLTGRLSTIDATAKRVETHARETCGVDLAK